VNFCFFALARLAAGARRFLVNVTGDVTGGEGEEGASESGGGITSGPPVGVAFTRTCG
jgi:hypothetical protein